MASENQVDFRALPSQIAKEVLRKLNKNWKGCFAALRTWKKTPEKFLSKPKLPKYEHKVLY